MEAVSPIIDIISCLWNCSAVHKSYLCGLKEHVSSLKISLTKLKERRDDVKEKVERAEANPTKPMKRTHEVSGWLPCVEALEQEVESILQKVEAGNNEGGSYFCCWGRKNCCSGYKLGRLVAKKMKAVEKLCEEGNFKTVVEDSHPDPVREMAANHTVGMDSQLEEIWSLLADETNPVRIVGLYGMGGVGKTTLLTSLNNEFLKRNHHFDLIIWVLVSQVLSINDIQKQIGKSLGLSWLEGTNTDDKAKDIIQVLRNKNFVLFLDDIWGRVDLQKIGIPYVKNKTQSPPNKSRVIFSTRSEAVCGFMQADETIRVNCLDWDDSWRLFEQNVGSRALSCHPDVSEFAIKVAKECLGLPLALITIGQTMASKKTLQEWQYALIVLQKSASEFSGMVDRVLAILKFSYDNLENEKLKSCFLYCSVYPEDYSIQKEELIKLWIGEAYLNEVDDIVKAYIEGYDVIQSLKSACLLESGRNEEIEVKMHDVIRDLAIWIASDLGKEKGKYIAVQGREELKLREWKKAEKISVVNFKYYGYSLFKDKRPICLNLSTLLLQRSYMPDSFDDFFQSMPKLKVLDMYRMAIDKLPTSIFSLQELQYLDLSYVSCTDNIGLRQGSIDRLTKLKMLDLFDSKLSTWEFGGGPCLSELESLKDLNYLGIRIHTVLALQKLACSRKLQLCTKLLQVRTCLDMKTLVLSPPSLSSSSSSSPTSSLVSLANMVHLKTLDLECHDLEELRIVSRVGMEDNINLFTTLEKFFMKSMPKLKIVCDVPPQSTFSFVNLKVVEIWSCLELKDITWLIYAQNLETLALFDLGELEEVISDGFASKEKLKTTFSRLNSLSLNNMPKLQRICSDNVKFFSLVHIQVTSCPNLKSENIRKTPTAT